MTVRCGTCLTGQDVNELDVLFIDEIMVFNATLKCGHRIRWTSKYIARVMF
jgi:hypothetical protein